MPAAHTGTRIHSDAVSENQQLSKELHKPIIRKFVKTSSTVFF